MMKAQTYPVYHFLYALLVSHILEYKVFNVDSENTRVIQAASLEIGETTLQQMGFVARENIFVHKDEADKDDEYDYLDAHMVEPVNEVDPSTTSPSVTPSSSSFSIEENLANLSRQRDEMNILHLTRHEELLEVHQYHYSYVIERFEYFDARLGNIEDCLNIQPLDLPLSPEF